MFTRITLKFAIAKYVASAKAGMALCLIASLVACGGETTSDNAVQHLKQAEAYMNSGQYRAAMIEARNVIQKAPSNQNGYIALAKISNALGGYDHTISQLEALQGASGGDYVFTLAKAYIGRGKYRTADKFLTKHEAVSKAADPAKFALLKADTLVGLNKLDAAITHYDTAAKLAKNDIDPLLGLTAIYRHKGMTDELKSVADRIDALPEPSAKSYAFKARQAFEKGDLESTEKMLTESLALLPASDLMTPLRSGVIGLLAEVLTRSGRSAEALVYTRILAEAFPGAELTKGIYREAIGLFDKGDLDGAEKKLLEVLEQSPGNERASQLLGVINYMQGDLEDASGFFDGNYDPELASDKLQQVYALTNMRLNKPGEVLRLLEDNIETTKSAETLGLYGLAALSAGREEEGVKALDRAIALDPQKVRLNLALAGYFNALAQPNHEKALGYIESAYNTTGKDPFVQKALIQQHLIMKNKGKAERLVAEVLKNYSNEYASHIIAGSFADAYGQSEQALQHYTKALDIAPKEALVLESVGKAYLKAQRWAAAKNIFEQYMGAVPESLTGYRGFLFASDRLGELKPVLESIAKVNQGRETPVSAPYIALGQYYVRAQQFDEARKNLEYAQHIDPDSLFVKRLDSAINYSLAVAEKADGNFKSARTHAFNGLKSSPNNLTLLTLLAEIEIGSEKYKEAKKITEQISDENIAVGEHLQGDLLAAQDNVNAALPLYQSSWSSQPNELLANKLYAVYRRQNNMGEAVKILNEWASKFPQSVRALAARGSFYIDQENMPGARADFENALKIVPDSPVILNNLAWVKHQLKDKSAEETASKAVKLAPESAPILDTYGWILHENGKTDIALPYLKKANTLAPDNKDIQQHLSAALEE